MSDKETGDKKKSGAPTAAGTKAKAPKPKNAKAGGAERNQAQVGSHVAHLRNKLTEAMQDPLTREQIVRAIRALMQEK